MIHWLDPAFATGAATLLLAVHGGRLADAATRLHQWAEQRWQQ